MFRDAHLQRAPERAALPASSTSAAATDSRAPSVPRPASTRLAEQDAHLHRVATRRAAQIRRNDSQPARVPRACARSAARSRSVPLHQGARSVPNNRSLRHGVAWLPSDVASLEGLENLEDATMVVLTGAATRSAQPRGSGVTRTTCASTAPAWSTSTASSLERSERNADMLGFRPRQPEAKTIAPGLCSATHSCSGARHCLIGQCRSSINSTRSLRSDPSLATCARCETRHRALPAVCRRFPPCSPARFPPQRRIVTELRRRSWPPRRFRLEHARESAHALASSALNGICSL